MHGIEGLGGLQDHLDSPRGRGGVESIPHRGAAGGSACGDLVTIGVRAQSDRITEARFEASGCAAAEAAGSAVVELVGGRPALEAARLTAGSVAAELGGLSPARRHAAVLAVDAFHRALGSAAAAGEIRIAPDPNRTVVAMSGGVDSAVAARVALEAGHEVVAVTLELWADAESDGAKSCCSPHAVSAARALAHGMGLAHLTIDLRTAFREEVVADFLAEHRAGNTPNPCVRCNGRVRFTGMLELAESLGAERHATGHYARLTQASDDGRPLLTAAADSGKDQTYMLAALPADQLERLWFPLGSLTKPEVRALARDAGLSVADKAESQDLCFLAGTVKSRFLERHGAPGTTSGEGAVLDLEGRELGRHPGQERFTIGQRRGLGLAAPEPLYVVAKDAAANTVTVGPLGALAATTVALANIRLHRPARTIGRVKLRYRQDPIDCTATENLPAGEHPRLRLRLERPVDGVAPGQTACLMDGERVVGWGRIESGEAAPIGG